MDKSLDLLFKYPLIQSSKVGENVLYQGKIFIYNKDYKVSILHKTSSNQYKLNDLDANDSEALNNITGIVSNNNYGDIMEVLDKIKCELNLKHPLNEKRDVSDIYLKVLFEYSEFTKFFLNLQSCTLQKDLSEIDVSILDEGSREHRVKIGVDYIGTSKNIFNLQEFDLPQKNQEILFKPSDNLTALFDEFLAQIQLLQPYFDIMEELDKYCSILDPDSPKRKDCYRRIFLGDNISCVVTVDPFNIFLRPDIRFLGPNRLVENYNTKLNDNLFAWTCENGIFQGLLNLLGLDNFPKHQTVRKSSILLVDYGECSICFCLRLNDKLPEIICTNKCCEKCYHNQCLYEWLTAINAKRVFNNVTGNCPNCEKTISCPVLE